MEINKKILNKLGDGVEEPTETEISVKFEEGKEKVDGDDDWNSGKMSGRDDYPTLSSISTLSINFNQKHSVNKHPILENKIPKERIKPKIFVLRQ